MTTFRTVSTALLCSGILCLPALAQVGVESALNKSKVSLHQAISASEKSTGGTVMEIKLDEEKDAPVYEVTVLKGDAVTHYKLDGTSTASMPMENKSIVAKVVDHEGKDERIAAATAQSSLKDAVAKVEKQTGGQAIEASIEVDDKKAQYVVEVLVGSKEVKHAVDATTGNIIAK